MQANRREFLALCALWSQALEAAQSHSHPSATGVPGGPYKFKFFTTVEVQTLQSLAALLIPADERSGGAKAARVEEYIDFILGHGEKPLQSRWRKGLKSFASIAEDRREFHLHELSANEFNPSTADEEFFVLLKSAVVEAFYTSEEGIQKELGYQGLGFMREFPGCTHESHSAPEDYQPRLRARQA